jgi:hypothetical protein
LIIDNDSSKESSAVRTYLMVTVPAFQGF